MENLIFFELLILASFLKACMDRLKTNFWESIFFNIKNMKIRNWFDPNISWQSKWKNGCPSQGEAFFGSSTFMVWVTDGWHFIQKLYLTVIFLMVILYHPFIGFWQDFLIMYFVFTVSFETFYRLLKREL